MHASRSEPLNAEKWFSFFDDAEGRLRVEISEVREAVFRGVSFCYTYIVLLLNYMKLLIFSLIHIKREWKMTLELKYGNFS